MFEKKLEVLFQKLLLVKRTKLKKEIYSVKLYYHKEFQCLSYV